MKPPRIPLIVRFLEQLKSPLILNGYAMVFSAGINAMLGVVYWVLAARLYPEEVVGLNSAALAAMFFLANISQLNLIHALNRFVPSAGQATTRLILTAYLVSAGLAVVASTIFLIGVGIWSPSLSALSSSPSTAAWFIFATVSWCIFSLQDGVLAGLRQAKWVALSTASYALVKLAMIVLFATALPSSGVFFSWTAPVLLLIVPVSALIFLRLVPRHVAAAALRGEEVRPQSIVRFVAGDYLSSLIWTATLTLLPILVVEQAGAASGAHFYLTWTIAYTLYFVSVNMCMSLVTEGARDEKNLNYYSYQTLKQTLRLMVPVVAIVVIGAPYILRLYGSSYADEGTTLLRLLSLSAIPYIFIAIRISMARVQRQIRKIFYIQVALCTVVLVSSYVFLDLYGIVGIGVAWLLGQSAVMLTLLITDLLRMWLPYLELPDYLINALKGAAKAARFLTGRRYLAHAEELLAAATKCPTANNIAASGWRIIESIPTSGDVKVFILTDAKETEVAVLKVPASQKAAQGLQRHVQALSQLHTNADLGEWRKLLPLVLTAAWLPPQAYIIETKLPGVRAERLLFDLSQRDRILEQAARAITKLHQSTAAASVVDDTLIEQWVNGPLRIVEQLVGSGSSKQQAITQLADALRAALLGRRVMTSRIHGDFSPQNVLFHKDGSEVSGLVDWELSAGQHLSALDLVHLLLSTRMLLERKELGTVLSEILVHPTASTFDAHLLTSYIGPDQQPPVSFQTLALLCWLQHVKRERDMGRFAAYASNAFWIAKNVEAVLESAVTTGNIQHDLNGAFA